MGFEDNRAGHRLPAAVKTTAYRIRREALANARQHAGAQRVDVALRLEPGWLVLDVHDAGMGLPGEDTVPGPGPGTVQHAGARALARRDVHSDAGRGTRVQARLPLLPEPSPSRGR